MNHPISFVSCDGLNKIICQAKQEERERILKKLPEKMEYENSDKIQIADGYNQYRREIRDIIFALVSVK